MRQSEKRDFGLEKSVSGRIKPHAATDPDTNRILAYAVTDGSCGDSPMMDPLLKAVESAGHRIGRILADVAYDGKTLWSEYSSRGTDVAVNIKSPQLDAHRPTGRLGIKARGCMPRAKAMTRILEVGRDRWKEEVGYGRRWKVECTLLDIKRLFGDILRSRTRRSDAEETVAKVLLLNEYKEIRMSCRGSS